MKRLFWTLFVILILGTLYFVWVFNQQQDLKQSTPDIPAITSATVLTPPKPMYHFGLKDANGQPFTLESLQGHWTLMFFGYADCPEICPTTLAIVSGAWRAFPEHTPHPKAQFVFATLNPQSDTPEKLKTFLSHFNPNFIGVTGEESELNNLSKSLSIYSWTDPQLNAAGQKVIDHSATLLLINPEGRLHALFTPPHQIENLKKDLQILMNR